MLGITTTDSARGLTDEAVLTRARHEPWLFAVLLERYQDAFLRKARRIVRDIRDAEEIVQDTFAKIYINADRFEARPGATFSSWAYKILLNTAFSRYQKCLREGKRTMSLDPEFEQLVGDLSEHSGFREDTDVIERILARMPGKFAQVLRLHYLERWPHADIAEHTGESVGAVKTRIHRAKEHFRTELARTETLPGHT